MKRLMMVIVLVGIVEVQNGLGTLACAAGDTATVEEGKAPRKTASFLGFTWKSDKDQKDRLIVAAVQPSSAAAEGKFQPGDWIKAVENQPVTTPQAFTDRVEFYATGTKLKVLVERPMANLLTLWLVRPESKSLSDKNVQWVSDWLALDKEGHPLTGVFTVIPKPPDPKSRQVFLLEEKEFVNGLHVRSTTFNEDSTKSQEFIHSYDDLVGLTPSDLQPKTTTSINYHPNGQKRQVSESYQNEMSRAYDHDHSVFKVYDASGTLLCECERRGNKAFGTDGRLFTGLFPRDFYPNGQKERAEIFRDGVLVGIAEWRKDGSKSSVNERVNGRRKFTRWDKNGNVTRETSDDDAGMGSFVKVGEALKDDLVKKDEEAVGIKNLQSELGLQAKEEADGLTVTAVVKGMPAEKAGLQKEDVITAVEKHQTLAWKQLKDVVKSYALGSLLYVTGQRKGTPMTWKVQLEAPPAKK